MRSPWEREPDSHPSPLPPAPSFKVSREPVFMPKLGSISPGRGFRFLAGSHLIFPNYEYLLADGRWVPVKEDMVGKGCSESSLIVRCCVDLARISSSPDFRCVARKFDAGLKLEPGDLVYFAFSSKDQGQGWVEYSDYLPPCGRWSFVYRPTSANAAEK
jgi:hypothetical protein